MTYDLRPTIYDSPSTLTWNQVASWRMSRHILAERAAPDDLLGVASRLCGLHAQVASAAELSAWVRMHPGEPGAVSAALWQDRTLVKTWAMRGTLHLIVADELPTFMAARRTINRHLTPGYLKYFDLTRSQMVNLIESIGTALDGRCLTRDELALEVGRITGETRLGDQLRSGWGSFLKPAAALGYLCFGPNQGRNVTFVRPDQWLGTWPEIDPDWAMSEVLRRYLSTYGPTRRDEFAQWFGAALSTARRAFERLADELTEVQFDGTRAYVLSSTLDDMLAVPAGLSVRLLPNFDPYMIGLSPQVKRHIPPEQLPRVFRTAGWISPVVLVDGNIVGVWGYQRGTNSLKLTVDIFEQTSASPEIISGIEVEAEHLTGLLGGPLDLRYDTITFGG
jgi:hypothetical protein